MPSENKLKKTFQFCLIAGLLSFPVFCWPADMDTLKADFLRGNYRRVIFEGQAAMRRSDELNCILGQSYLKESNLSKARECFKEALKNPSSKFKEQAKLGLADTYLLAREYREAEDIYNKLLTEKPNTGLKAVILYRLSQSSLKKGDHRRSNEYLLKLKKDFPLSPELKLTRGIPQMEASGGGGADYSVQVGFFASSANAGNLEEKLCSLGFAAYLEEAAGGYRVRVGRFKSLDEALEMERRLSQKGFPTKVCP